MSGSFKYKIGIIIVISIASILFILAQPAISLTGKDKVKIKLGEEYSELGYKASFMFKDYTKDVKVKNNINNEKIGDYQVTYTVKVGKFKTIKIRTVEVIDDIDPVIELTGTGNACPDSEYTEEGYKATDNYDGDITDKVVVKVEKDKITYVVSDSSGNRVTKIRDIAYQDVEPPTLDLNGDSEINIYRGTKFEDMNYTVKDNCDSDPQVTVSGSVDTNQVGKYTLTYEAVDKYGNKSSATRTVNVVSSVRSNENNNGTGKVIYLTFDDGPSSSITPSLLQILREEGVKATFFVINHGTSLDYLIKQEHDEGHVVALHSYTHNYGQIYASEQAFYDDLNAIREKVHGITGVYSNLIRFPGGSSNTVSRKNPGIMSRLVVSVQNNGYHYFDWNVSSGDAGGSNSASEVYNAVVSHLVYKNNVVLCHDYEGNYKTLNAIRDIIRYGKQNGYTFATLNENSYGAHHPVNN